MSRANETTGILFDTLPDDLSSSNPEMQDAASLEEARDEIEDLHELLRDCKNSFEHMQTTYPREGGLMIRRIEAKLITPKGVAA